MFGEVFRSQESEPEAKCDVCLDTEDQMVWNGRGMRSEVTARVISSVSARYSAQMAVGHRLDSFHAACICEGGGRNIAIGRRNSPLFTKAAPTSGTCPSAPSAPLQLEDNPGTRD